MDGKACQDGVHFQCSRDDLWPSHPIHNVGGGFPEWKLIWGKADHPKRFHCILVPNKLQIMYLQK